MWTTKLTPVSVGRLQFLSYNVLKCYNTSVKTR